MLGLLVSGGVALWIAILSTPFLIRYFRKRELGQHIREDGPATHCAKAGTPTMGGIAIVGAVVSGYAIGHIGTEIRFSRTGYLAIGAVVAFGLIGFFDDYIKVHHRAQPRAEQAGKSAAQLVCALVFAVLAVHWAHTSTALSFTRVDGHRHQPGAGRAGSSSPSWSWSGASNAVNITDGVDGLAAGLGHVLLRRALDHGVLDLPALRHLPRAPGVGRSTWRWCRWRWPARCIGFLWWNAAPAKIIMGDTGSLAIGAGLAALCLLLNLDLLLLVIGGLFVMETLSVILQVISFRAFHRRIFRMAPIHHHFELGGWPETTVIVRFWILGGLFCALGLGIFYGDFLTVAKFT